MECSLNAFLSVSSSLGTGDFVSPLIHVCFEFYLQAITVIGKEEGVRGYWKGNLPQVMCFFDRNCCLLPEPLLLPSSNAVH